MKQHHLILGGMRSGKSHFALQCADTIRQEKHCAMHFIATATAIDAEMQARIERHQRERDTHWHLIEAPTDIASIIEQFNANDCLLIDCLTLWLNNCLYHNVWQEQEAQFFAALAKSTAHCLFVSNEISMGVIPLGIENRRYVDALGRLHQKLAQHCDRVTLMVAGIAQTLK